MKLHYNTVIVSFFYSVTFYHHHHLLLEFAQWDQPAGPRPHCWGVEQRSHLGHHGGDCMDSIKKYPTIRGGQNLHPHKSQVQVNFSPNVWGGKKPLEIHPLEVTRYSI